MSQQPDLFSALKQQGTLCDQTVAYLTDLIVSGQVSPGDFFPSEAELCRRLKVSRTTMREAVRILEARGFIRRRHGIGIEVVDRSHEAATSSISLMLQRKQSSIRDLAEVRMALECEAAALAATRATDSDLRALAAAVEVMERPSSTIDEYIEADLDFHLRLVRSSHNGVLVSFINAVRDLLQASIRSTYVLDGRTERRLNDHVWILEAILKRDPDDARQAARSLLLNSQDKLRQLGLIEPAEESASSSADEAV